MNNNRSVALLKNNQPQEALDAALDTDKIFEGASDPSRQGIALGNQAAALEALGRADEALALYERAASLFDDANEKEMRAIVLKSIAAIKLKQGKINEAGFEMLGALGATPKPTFFQRILKFFLRFVK